MADEFRSYDKTPIMSRLNISRWGCGIRELILLVICGFLFILVLIFAALYGIAGTQLFSGKKASASAIIGTTYCTDKECIRTAGRVLGLMNRSVDPCENFFEFACGNYKFVKPTRTGAASRTVLNDVYNDNMNRLVNIIETHSSQMHDYAAERKVKDFYQSCYSSYTREKYGGK